MKPGSAAPAPGGASADPSMRCPCLSGETYGGCCGRFHHGAAAPTAEQLMRSRYAAFAVGDARYLLRTWHSSTRPEDLVLDPAIRWRRLDILAVERGGPFDDAGTVEFRAFFRTAGATQDQHERSSFVREGGHWVYLGPLPLA